MKKYTIILVVAGILIITTLGIIIPNSNGAENWKTFEDTNIGIKFKYPEELKPFTPREMFFRECYDCRGLIYVKSEEIGNYTVEEYFNLRDFLHNEIIKRTSIGGSPAIITVSNDYESTREQKTIYVIKNDVIYTISARISDFESFLKTIELTTNE